MFEYDRLAEYPVLASLFWDPIIFLRNILLHMFLLSLAFPFDV